MPTASCRSASSTVAQTVGTNWLVKSGIDPGDRVIVEGLQYARAGQKANAVAFVARDDNSRAAAAATCRVGTGIEVTSMLSRFFIDRPIFAWVIAIFIALAGVLAIVRLPVEQYPSIAPPQVVIQTMYPGASAETAQNSVTQVIEQQLTGIDNLMYFASTTGSTGQVQITATFLAGTNPDIAQVQVQNKVQQASSRLPQEVRSRAWWCRSRSSAFS